MIISNVVLNQDMISSMDYNAPLLRVTYNILSDDASINIITVVEVDRLRVI